MIKSSFFISMILLCFGCKELSHLSSDNPDISLMSFNLRYDTEEDGNNMWDNRKAACVTLISEYQPSVFGIQEGLYNQVTFLKDNLKDYTYVGVGRDDGKTQGEYSAIFYADKDFDFVETGNFWLSETPEIPSLGWDASNIRIATWVKLRDKKLKKDIFILNTHFDHMGVIAQEESSKLIAKRISGLVKNEVIGILGDFNVLITDPKLKPISSEFIDAKRLAPKTDNLKSYNGWGSSEDDVNIDFIFFKNMKAVSFETVVKDYGVPYVSDHYPVFSTFEYLN